MAKFIKELRPDNVMILDSMNVAFRWKHKGSLVFAEEYLRTVQSLARSYDAGQVIITADKRGSSYRKEIFPEYKANRKELVENQTPKEKAEIEAFFEEYEKALELLDKKFLVLRYDGVEADDIAAYIVSHRHEYGIKQIWLISSDTDWDLLVKDDVSRFSTVTRKEITVDTWPYPVPPEKYIDYKCLIGDKSDNIPGVDGVGPKRAAKLIEQYGSALDICDMAPLPGKYKYIQSVNDSISQIRLNFELMDLESFCEDALGSQNVGDIGRKLMLNERLGDPFD